MHKTALKGRKAYFFEVPFSETNDFERLFIKRWTGMKKELNTTAVRALINELQNSAGSLSSAIASIARYVKADTALFTELYGIRDRLETIEGGLNPTVFFKSYSSVN